ncbi:site-2 protease family protein [Candidatus Woesearchaeota archaeon]|nr:site-2 protease family protein [Candidatus Woesearchaeota archaeon]
MDTESVGAIVFIVLLGLVLYFERKKISLQKILFPLVYLVMYRTEFGIKLMDRTAKRFPRLLKWLAYAGIIVGFIGMALLMALLFQNLYDLFTKPEAVSGVGVVLPIKAKGVFFVPFFYWVTSIFILAVVHEFSHGVISRVYGIRVKSSGLAFLSVLIPIIPAAFVEPDENALQKRPYREQLSVFAAGPFSNMIVAFAVLLMLIFAVSPIVGKMVDFRGATIVAYGGNETAPVELAGIKEGETILAINGTQIRVVEDLSAEMAKHKPLDTIPITTDWGNYLVTLGRHPANESMPYLGVTLEQHYVYRGWFESHEFTANAILWVTGMPERVGWQLSYPVRGYGLGLLFWVYLLNIGIGMFNLIPIGPIDGGRMIQLPLRKILGRERGDKAWKYISMATLLLVLASVAFAFL